MLPQPPPNAPPPPPNEAARRSHFWKGFIWTLGIISIIVTILLAAVTVIPFIFRKPPNRDIEASNNLRKLGLALLEFETEFGTTPSAATIPLVNATNPSHGLTLGTHSSNDFFRQLFASDWAQSETMFWAFRKTSRKPDNIFIGPEALKPGECAFAYILGQTLSTGAKSPIALYPLVPGTPKFDYKLAKEYLYSKAIILWTDNSVTSLPIDPTGKVLINGKDLFDPTQPFWHGTPPDIKWPD
jgi:hypothetical protein